MVESLPIKGAAAISQALGIGRREIAELVATGELKAYKRRGRNSPWMIMPEDAAAFSRAQRDRFLDETGA